jgi:selenide, water dikinase
MDEIRLTSFSSAGGCASKLPPEYLSAALASLGEGVQLSKDIETLSDAAVYKLNDEDSLIFSVDFFTPVVDDPYAFGQIVAANSINDIYAMNGKPVIALNIVEFPSDSLDISVLGAILKGGRDKAAEAGVIIAGGHSLRGPEIKYGMAVIGIAKTKEIVHNSGAQPGDRLVLTKPLGVGIIANAIKHGIATDEQIKTATKHMSSLNDKAAGAMNIAGVTACTDITGFGFLGHAMEMAKASNVGIELNVANLLILDEARELVKKLPSMQLTCSNNTFYSSDITGLEELDSSTKAIMFSPQTAGGLLISVSAENFDVLMMELSKREINAVEIGCVTKLTSKRINIL